MIRAFTGPSKMTHADVVWATERLAQLRPNYGETWRSGCAYGLDTLVARMARAYHDVLDLELYVPFAPHNETLVRDLAPYARHVIRCPKGVTAAKSYRIRNDWMVRGSDDHGRTAYAYVLHAFVRQDDFYRSGEWMTINIAVGAGLKIVKEVLPREVDG